MGQGPVEKEKETVSDGGWSDPDAEIGTQS
jgi:hypothetical protein